MFAINLSFPTTSQYRLCPCSRSAGVASSSSPAVVPARSQRCKRTACFAAGKDGEADGVDIDQLAKLLSQRAQALRESYDEQEFREAYQEFEPPVSSSLPTALVVSSSKSTAELETQVFKEIGIGGFESEDFEILQQLGRISVQEAGSLSNNRPAQPRNAVIVYVASLIPRVPLQRQTTSLLKEYLPVARAVAYNELLVMAKLAGIPAADEKYAVAQAAPSRRPPVVPLLGYFTSAPTEEAASITGDEGDSVWLVYKWEGLRPLNLFFDVGPPQARVSWFKRKEDAESEAWEGRHAMLRAIARGLLSAVAFCHTRGVVHGSLSNGTVLLSSTEDDMAEDLLVKLDNFGFGRLTPSTAAAGEPEELQGRKQDLQAVGLVLAETFSHGTAVSEQGKLLRPTLQRLLFEIYHEDIYQFREYCESEPSLAFDGLLQFLDDRESAGWDFLSLLLKGEWTAECLLQHPFFKPRK